METVDINDVLCITETAEDVGASFGKTPQPWQLRNNWVKPKRKRKRRRVEIDLWEMEN